ncbi:MAG: class I SAM-dependent methyltransferase [Acidobacteria bacterium]|nr:class I SAM-dependent methyltransferase [Acidobacteriota bacterium]
MSEPARRRWARAYARLRRTEGRGAGGTRELFALPWVTEGPLAAQWRIRARTFDAFLRRVVAPLERERGRALRVLDLGAGNGWLSARLAARGHRCVAADLRVDDVDGLAAAAPFARRLARMFGRVAASFDALPLGPRLFDIVVFDASLHLAEDLHASSPRPRVRRRPAAASRSSPPRSPRAPPRATRCEPRSAARPRRASPKPPKTSLRSRPWRFLTKERLAAPPRPRAYPSAGGAFSTPAH